jgi:hypothetical protein
MKYNFNKEADEHLKELYNSYGAKTLLQKIKVIEKEGNFGEYTITHFRYGSRRWLAALETSYLHNKKMIELKIC